MGIYLIDRMLQLKTKNSIDENNQNNILKYIFALVIFLTVIQQFPIINESFYSQMRLIIYTSFILLLIIPFFSFKKLLQVNFIKLFTISIFSSTLIYFVYYMRGLEPTFTELLIPFGILLIAMTINLNKRDFNIIILLYTTLALIMGITNVFYYVGSFQITELYEIPGKNQIGAIIGSSIIIFGVGILKGEFLNNYIKYYFYVGFLILFMCLLVIRNRASIMAILLVLILLFVLRIFKKITYQKIIYFIIIVIIFIILTLLGVLNLFYNFIWESFTLNFDKNDLNALSSGRTNVYIVAVQQFFESPFFGELFQDHNIDGKPHNFILNKLVSYGILGSFPIIILYIYILYFTIKGIFKYKGSADLVFWLLLYSLIISQFEYTYPFGPGVSQIILWFVLGHYLKRRYISKI